MSEEKVTVTEAEAPVKNDSAENTRIEPEEMSNTEDISRTEVTHKNEKMLDVQPLNDAYNTVNSTSATDAMIAANSKSESIKKMPEKQDKASGLSKAKKSNKKHSRLFASAVPAKESAEENTRNNSEMSQRQHMGQNAPIIGKSGAEHTFYRPDAEQITAGQSTTQQEAQSVKKKKSRFQTFIKRMKSTDPKYDRYKKTFYNGYKIAAGTVVAAVLIVASISSTAGIWSLRNNSALPKVSPGMVTEKTENARTISVSARNKIAAEKDIESVSYKITVGDNNNKDKLQDAMDSLEEIAKTNSLNGSDGYDMKDNGDMLIFSLKGLPTSKALTIQAEIENILFKKGFDYETVDPKYSASAESVKKAYKNTVLQTIKDAESDAKYVAGQKDLAVAELTGIDVSTETVGKNDYVVVNAEYAVRQIRFSHL